MHYQNQLHFQNANVVNGHECHLFANLNLSQMNFHFGLTRHQLHHVFLVFIGIPVVYLANSGATVVQLTIFV